MSGRNALVITGLEELRHVLKNLPSDLAGEAEPIIDNRAELSRSEIVQRYPRRTGNLRKGVSVTDMRIGPYGPGRKLSNRAPHAWLFEHGTEARQNKLGALRGKMPPGHVFIPIAIRHKRILQKELVAMLETVGLIVTGVED